MLSLVDNIRRKQVAWIEAILDYRKWNRTRLAREAGVDHSTIAKFFNDPQKTAQLNTTTVEKIAAAGGIPPYQTRPPALPRGVAESEAEPYEAHLVDDMVARAVAAAKADQNGLDPWILRSRALELAGYLPGDVLMIDFNAPPVEGEVVCAQTYDRHGRAETVFRIYEPPFLVAVSTDPTLFKPLLIDDDRVIVRGTRRMSFRPEHPRRAA